MKRILPMLLACLLVVLDGPVAVGGGTLEMTLKEIDTEIARSLPQGTSREKVIEFLNAHNVENSSSSWESKDRIIAIFRNIKSDSILFKEAIQVIFQFQNGMLKNYSIHEKLIGP